VLLSTLNDQILFHEDGCVSASRGRRLGALGDGRPQHGPRALRHLLSRVYGSGREERRGEEREEREERRAVAALAAQQCNDLPRRRIWQVSCLALLVARARTWERSAAASH